MLENQELEEVITVRVQDPRVQNEGSWNSYVDYKIFLHTNSKAFTAKTSCVRRRYREFVWLRKQLQRNAGLVPVPELPGKSTFFGSSDEFIEKRRQGLQLFLEKVLQSVVLLSDSQLHLFLQSQLSVPEIEACVQGRGSMSVSDAILSYAMSNCGWAQEERQSTSHLAKGDQLNRVSLCRPTHYISYSVCRPGWSQTHKALPASRVRGLKLLLSSKIREEELTFTTSQ
ncbi:sorting nexin-11 isoform X2 [Psammomys obesus]|uniref:sorting nexin-11 isoform X2 n=1 Tax=Psammomys obesus TaxID=48139 RepID=UPI0024530F3A|nr:sorting nexin-11 isoform X2 [Psammomys obesus]